MTSYKVFTSKRWKSYMISDQQFRPGGIYSFVFKQLRKLKQVIVSGQVSGFRNFCGNLLFWKISAIFDSYFPKASVISISKYAKSTEYRSWMTMQALWKSKELLVASIGHFSIHFYPFFSTFHQYNMSEIGRVLYEFMAHDKVVIFFVAV